MATTTASWWTLPMAPRKCAGEISLKYSEGTPEFTPVKGKSVVHPSAEKRKFPFRKFRPSSKLSLMAGWVLGWKQPPRFLNRHIPAAVPFGTFCFGWHFEKQAALRLESRLGRRGTELSAMPKFFRARNWRQDCKRFSATLIPQKEYLFISWD